MPKTYEKQGFRHFLASLPGFEPGAFRLGGGPSILLRYRDMYEILSTLLLAF